MKLSTLILVLASLWSEKVATGHHTLKVKPNEVLEGTACQCSDLNNDCEDPEPCETLSFYATQQGGLLCEIEPLNLLFLKGRHWPINFTTEVVEISDKTSLVLQGEGEGTVLANYKFRLSSIQSILISDVTGEGLMIDLDTSDDKPHLKLSNVTIRNCAFINSALVFKAILLHIADSRFTDNSQTKLYSSYLTFHDRVSFLNNNAASGGALSLIESVIYVKGNCSVDFTNNSAEETGGAVLVENNDECFYVITEAAAGFPGHSIINGSDCKLHFRNNKAKNGGDHIYGTSFMSNCPNHGKNFPNSNMLGANWSDWIVFEQPKFNARDRHSLSAVSSVPSRVCLCNDEGLPECTNIDKIFVQMETCPGENIDIPIVLVGADFGTTTGSVHVNVLHEKGHHNSSIHNQVLAYPVHQNKRCTTLKLKTVLSTTLDSHSTTTHQHVYLTLTTADARHISSTNINSYKREVQRQIVYYETHRRVKDLLRYTPIFVNLSLSECPPGFTINTQNGTGCDCYRALKNSISNLRCTLEDHRGYMSWNTTAWIGFDEDNNLIYSKHCFPYYCRRAYKKIDMGNTSMLNTQQCWPNREGILCSKCTKGHSLAIGSSNCIHVLSQQ
jgi:hypothetical protein